MKTRGRATCPLPSCGYVREDYSDAAAQGWILHILLHIYYQQNKLPEGVK